MGCLNDFLLPSTSPRELAFGTSNGVVPMTTIYPTVDRRERILAALREHGHGIPRDKIAQSNGDTKTMQGDPTALDSLGALSASCNAQDACLAAFRALAIGRPKTGER